MRIAKLVALAAAALFVLPACNIHVKKDNDGQEKNVDINTPFGGIHVDKNADARDTGIPVYPGARIKDQGDSGDDKSANVNISGLGYGLKVVAIEYESDAAAKAVLAFYRDQLKKYGSVLECHTSGTNVSMNHHSGSDSSSDELGCDSNSGPDVELKAGTASNQHIVAVKAQGSGSDFSLVYVRTHGKDTI